MDEVDRYLAAAVLGSAAKCKNRKVQIGRNFPSEVHLDDLLVTVASESSRGDRLQI